MEVLATEFPDVKVVIPRRLRDERGFFSEIYSKLHFHAVGVAADFVQENHSFSERRGTVRGLHFQRDPHAQAKLVRASRGSVLDVIVDIRFGSPTYGRHIGVTLDCRVGNQIYVPVGFAHGFCTLEDNTEVQYKVTDYYFPADDAGLLWCDPDLKIAWPVSPEAAIVSAKDARLPRLSDLPACFRVESAVT